ncbi:MAG: hypothetical protein DHS20C11_13820 [Lysobacteraceae bacterium]|nr:MAG: hypothetical protein DHS20C11_13820 [Xanthomonadaceae bacterium]
MLSIASRTKVDEYVLFVAKHMVSLLFEAEYWHQTIIELHPDLQVSQLYHQMINLQDDATSNMLLFPSG